MYSQSLLVSDALQLVGFLNFCLTNEVSSSLTPNRQTVCACAARGGVAFETINLWIR